MNVVSIFTKINNIFLEVVFDWPDAMKNFERENKEKVNFDATSGCSENNIVRWVNYGEIKLISANMKELPKGNRHYVFSFDLRIEGTKGNVSNLRSVGVFSDAENDEYLKNINAIIQ